MRVTGICILHSSDTFHGPVTFDIQLRDFDDIAVVARPSPLNVHNLVILVGLLVLLLFVASIRSWASERKLRRQNAAAAEIVSAGVGPISDVRLKPPPENPGNWPYVLNQST